MAKTKKGQDWNPRTLSTFSTFGSSIPNSHSGGAQQRDEPKSLSDEKVATLPLRHSNVSNFNCGSALSTPKHEIKYAIKHSSNKFISNGILPDKLHLNNVHTASDYKQCPVKRKIDRQNCKGLEHAETPCKSEPPEDTSGVSVVTVNGDPDVPASFLHKYSGFDTQYLFDSASGLDPEDWRDIGSHSNALIESKGFYVKPSYHNAQVVRTPEHLAGLNPQYTQSIEINSPSVHSSVGAVRFSQPFLPQHSHSKSLVVEIGSPEFKPSHGYSRSLVDNDYFSAGSENFKNGIGTLTLFIGVCDRRFGFSVVGGADEGFAPRIDEIAEGSPADKADLEVGDEILEVNGKSLEDATHTEVISHIHQCIRSRTICLRVKRRTGNKLAADLAASSNVQDAFVIAVEQRARERLERLSALKKIKPVDISKLSSQLSDPQKQEASQSPSGSIKAEEGHSGRASPLEEVNGVLEEAPVYVTSLPNLRASQPESSSKAKQKKRPSSQSPSQRALSATPPSPSGETPFRAESSLKNRKTSSSSGRRAGSLSQGSEPLSEGDPDAGNKSGDELELTHDLDKDEEEREGKGRIPPEGTPDVAGGDSRSEDDVDDDVSGDSGDSVPATPEKTYGVASNREVLIDSRSYVQEKAKPFKHRTSLESSGSSRKSGTSSEGGSCSSGSKPYLSRAAPNDNMISMVEFDPSNKEMAVDVPDTFIARTKTPPRYPPPKLQTQVAPSPGHQNNNNYNSSKKMRSASSGSVTPLNGTLPKPVSPPRIPDSYKPVVLQSPNSEEEINKIKKYEEEIKQRRERAEATAELQRASIRGSQKLQALESYPHGQPLPLPTGMVNEAFSQEDYTEGDDKGQAPSINELIQSLQRIQTILKSNGHRISDDMTLVAQLLVNPEFQKVLAVHNKVQETWCLNRPPTPSCFKSQELLSEVVEQLKENSSPEAIELAEVLNKYSLEGLLYAHDRIADSEPTLEGEECEVTQSPVDRGTTSNALAADKVVNHYPEENVRIIRIEKTNEPLGATIRNEGDSVIIGRIVQGGAAEKSCMLQEGDEILEVNSVEVRGKSVNDVCDMLSGMMGTLTFIIIPNSNAPVVTQTTSSIGQGMHVKAHFDYDPEEDLYIPCRELGMSFQKGDILHVINQSDSNWWQAYRDGEDDQSLAGLVPSKSFQQQREAMRQTVVGDSGNKEKTKKGKLLCAKKNQKKKKKKMLYPNYNEDYDAEELLTYEEVDLYYPRSNRKRPIVLIGPPNIGRHEIRQKLMEDRERFSAAVPHTSRPKRDRELDGQDYHFISRTQFEADILARKFVEHGEYEKAYYGTSLDAIRAVVNSGKICVLNLHPLSLKMLKNSDLKPYVVLIAPPSLEKLRQKKIKQNEPFKEEELKEIIQKAREMEDQYGHYFDLVLINQDTERTYQQLIHEINILEREPQWVPASWLENER